MSVFTKTAEGKASALIMGTLAVGMIILTIACLVTGYPTEAYWGAGFLAALAVNALAEAKYLKKQEAKAAYEASRRAYWNDISA